MPSSVIELSQSALQNNFTFLKEQFKNTKISSVIKANAYGHGLNEFINMAGKCGINHFSVFSSREARKVKKYLTFPADIMIMGWINDDDMEWTISNSIDFFVFDFERIEKFIDTSKILGIPAKIHIDVETGMNRTGFAQKDINKLIKILLANREYFEFKGLCTHFAGAESIANYKRINDQIKTFNRLHKLFLKNNLIPEVRHTACSAAALTYPKTQFEMVRIGILQYGFWPSNETFIHYLSKNNIMTDPLKQILSWKSTIMSIKTVKTGEFISYGTSYLAQKDMKIAIIPVGYSHGYARNLSNQGRILINGQRVAVIGMVNMNMLIADVTLINQVALGDEVVLIGKKGDLTINVSSFAEYSDQLNYELLTRLPTEIPRVIIK
ncbi:MAG: alanine racemase [Bacteroidales bacterium]|jgi:alanine racemase|nr:alanine racemase [Bacteroidales bacterium]